MLAYRTTRCPYCGAKIDIMKPYGIDDYENDLGEPYGYCYSCGRKYSTGKQRWSQMNLFTKIVVVIKLIFNITLSSFFFSASILFVIYSIRKFVFENSFNWVEQYKVFDIILIGALILLPLVTIGGIIRFIQEIKEFE